MQRVYAFVVRRADSKTEALHILNAKSKNDALAKLHSSHTGAPFMAVCCGTMPFTDLLKIVVPQSTLDNPLQCIAALEYVASEYAPVLSAQDFNALKRIRSKVAGTFF